MQTQQHIDNTQPSPRVATIVHLGAGRCTELDQYLASEPEQILLVEADPELADDLRKRTKELPQVEVSQAVVAATEGPATFHRYNLPELSSLHPATGLLELFPGLKLVDKKTVDTICATDLVAKFSLGDDKNHRLVIDLPGEELPVLDSLNNDGALQRFAELTLYCGSGNLYAGSKPGQRVAEWLIDRGFDRIAKDDSRDPDRPTWRFRRNTLALQARELQEQLTELQQARDRQAIEIEQLENARDEQARLAAERQIKLQEATAALEASNKTKADLQQRLEQANQARAEQEKLAGERHTQIEQLKNARDEQAQLAAERQKNLEQAQNDLQVRIEAIAELQQRLDQAQQSCSKQEALVAQYQQAAEGLRAEIDVQNQQISELQGKLEHAEQRNGETEYRQRLLDEELVKAEAQIELIKDVVLREKAL